jgi:hypothetical protein
MIGMIGIGKKGVRATRREVVREERRLLRIHTKDLPSGPRRRMVFCGSSLACSKGQEASLR